MCLFLYIPLLGHNFVMQQNYVWSLLKMIKLAYLLLSFSRLATCYFAYHVSVSCIYACTYSCSIIINSNNKCLELGWTCILVAVETYGSWGKEAQEMFSRLSSHLAISMSSPKPQVVADIYGRLNITLVRSIARAILARDALPS